eukprot:362393_1
MSQHFKEEKPNTTNCTKQQIAALMIKLMELIAQIQMHESKSSVNSDYTIDELKHQQEMISKQIDTCHTQYQIKQCEKIGSSNQTYTKLINMGFSDTLCTDAANVYPDNIEQAVCWILQHTTSNDSNDVQCSLLSCCSLKRLLNIMTITKNNNENKFNIDDYFHLLIHHNSEADIEIIYEQFGGFCDIFACNVFKRNYRNRNKQQMALRNYSAQQQIIDKIHCYYCHIFDTGYRLKASEQKRIESVKEQKYDTVDDTKQNFINGKLFLLNQIIKNKTHKNCKELKQKGNTKFNQLLQNKEDIIRNDKSYCFGLKFKYGYDGEELNTYNECFEKDTKAINVLNKYSSLKQELISNKISSISISQYESEYKKAQIHFDSDYCKQKFRPVTEYKYKWLFCVEYVLALMIYCNFTELQYQFSKTFRTANGEQHNNFYYLGKSLKIAVRIFGTRICDNANIKRFFHGIGEKLLFPCYIGDIRIYCPLSTSSTFEVAMNFTNHNLGLVVEFNSGQTFGYAKYFAVSWLSDFGNENECLFLQNNKKEERLKISNIYDPKTGVEYQCILKALNIICKVLGNKIITDIPLLIKRLIPDILYDQLETK